MTSRTVHTCHPGHEFNNVSGSWPELLIDGQTASLDDALAIAAHELAELYIQAEILCRDTSLVEHLINQEVDGFTVDDLPSSATDCADMSLTELRDTILEYGDDSDCPDVNPWTADREELLDMLDGQLLPDDATTETLQQLAIIAIDDEEIDALDDWREAAQELCNDNPREIYQWFRVSSWLAGKLQEIGEPVLDNDFGYWWGRTCCGQAIILDGTMQQIARRTLAE